MGVGTGTVEGFTPTTVLVIRAAGRPPINTVTLPDTIEPLQVGPATKSPITEAGKFPINTVGTPGPVIALPLAVVSPNLAAGKDNLLFLQTFFSL